MNSVIRMGLAVAALALAAAGAQAQEHYHGGTVPQHAQHYDTHFNHNQYYPVHGMSVNAVPHTAVIVSHPVGGRYYYSGGVWYAPRGPHYVVIAAPVGVFVPVLPALYTTVWFGGIPYYYANDTYYQWRADQNGYEVVAPPANADDAGSASTQAPPSDDLFIYPQQGQSEDQQASDKYECHKWATSQTGFDPTQSGGGVPPEQAAAAHSEYQRAMKACLQGRGYSVR